MALRSVSHFLLFCHYFVLLRVQFLTWVVGMALGPAAIWLAPSLLRGLLYLDGPGVFLVTWFSLHLGYVVLRSTLLVLRYAPELYSLPDVNSPGLWWVVAVASHLPAVVLVGFSVYESRELGWGWIVLSVGLALLVETALRVLFRLVRLALLTEEDGKAVDAETHVWRPPLLQQANQRAIRAKVVPDAVRARGRRLLDRVNAPEVYRRPGYGLAAVLLSISLAVYALSGFWQNPFREAESYQAPALVFLLLILVVGCWLLSGLSFSLDRYRIPLLIILLLSGILASKVMDQDHSYETFPDAGAVPLMPLAEAAENWKLPGEAEGRPVVIAVAAAGGGIQAAAWTAQVLTGLSGEPDVGGRFEQGLRLVSTVSGGTAGAMFYLDSIRGQQGAAADPAPPFNAATRGKRLEQVVDNAATSGLEEIGWGLAYPDLWRMTPLTFLTSWFTNRLCDRGSALEKSWQKRLVDKNPKFSTLRTGFREGWLPATIFNSTIVETGQPLLFTNFRLRAPTGPVREPVGLHLFSEWKQGRDLPLTTAARLSATFPWVTPMARPKEGNDGYEHVADAGYYDNYGQVGLFVALNEALPELCKRFPDGKLTVVIVRIEAFPPAQEETGKANTGWLYQVGGPLIALVNVRTSAQRTRNQNDLLLLKQAWASSVRIEEIPFIFSRKDPEPPLTWILTKQQIAAIKEEWNSPENIELRQYLKRYLK
jgi:hypothetical protein